MTTAVFRYAGVLDSPIKVWNETIRNSSGKAGIANAVEEAVQQAMEDHFDELIIDLLHGVPSDQSANVWSRPHGFVFAMKTANTYGTLNRSNTTFTDPVDNSSVNYWNGKRVTTSAMASLDLIDDAMYEQGLYNVTSSPPDLVLVGSAIYHTLKKEALSRGQSVVVQEIPEAAQVGVKVEGIKYGPTTIIAEPFFTGDWSADDADITDATKLVAMFSTDDWIYNAHPSENFRVSEFVDQGETNNGDDALTAHLTSKSRLRCENPARSILYTNVSS
jgi:hypothetical protein